MAQDAPTPGSGDASAGPSLAARLEKNFLFILGGIVIGAFMSGVGTLLFIQRVVKSEIEDHWKGQLSTLARSAVDRRIKERFGGREPALVEHVRNGLNECVRVNDVQTCWGRETRTPGWDEKAGRNVLEHKFPFAAPFDGNPVVSVGIHPVKNQKSWVVYGSVRTPTSFQVRALDITKGPRSEEHVLMSYLAIGTPGKE